MVDGVGKIWGVIGKVLKLGAICSILRSLKVSVNPLHDVCVDALHLSNEAALAIEIYRNQLRLVSNG